MTNAEQVAITRNKIMRGQVLKTLALFYPDPIDISGIKSALMTRGITATADSIKVLHYLQDKKYIKITANKFQEITDGDLIEMTALGVDLIEDTIQDPGITI